jgi:hypothetical protein
VNSTNVSARFHNPFHNEEPEFLLPFLVASCALKHHHCDAKPHQWKVLKPLYETHSTLGLIVQSQLEHNHRATLFLNMFAKCTRGDRNGAQVAGTADRYSEHEIEILSADQITATSI